MRTLSYRIRRALTKGPATVSDLADALRLNSRRINPILCDLFRRGYVTREKYFRAAGIGRRNVWMYSRTTKLVGSPSPQTCARHAAPTPRVRVTPELVAEIRERNAEKRRRIEDLNNKYSVRAIADDLGLHPSTVQRIVNGAYRPCMGVAA